MRKGSRADSLVEAKSASGKAIYTGFVLQLKIALTNENQAAVFRSTESAYLPAKLHPR